MGRLSCTCGRGAGRFLCQPRSICQPAGPVWLGHVLGLNPLTLKYPTPGEEAGFLKHCTDRLWNAWCKCMIALVLVLSFWLVFLMDMPSDPADPAYPVLMFKFASLASCVALGIATLLVTLVPRLMRLTGPSTREKAIVLMILYFQLVSIFDKYHVAKIFGHHNPLELFPDLGGNTDSLVHTHCFMFLLVSHVCLPVRWFLLAATEAMGLAVYGAIIFAFGRPEPQSTICFVHFVVLVVLIAVGKRQSEVNERLVFTSMLAEKSLRMRAEYQLSQATTTTTTGLPARSSEDDASSAGQTTASAEIFNNLDGPGSGDQSNLQTVWEIGKKEQWLIDERELLVDPQVCLGSGGFGVVIAGEFHGSPVAIKLHIKTGGARPLVDIGNELRLLRKLRHPNIVLLHGACFNLNHNDLVIVMERVVGESMLQFINRQPAVAKCWKSLMDICHALMYLHSRHPPIYHGDLKPANVIVESRSMGIHAKLLDFGLSRLLTRSAKPGGGTYRWMAPGVLRSNGTIQKEDDVFAFGLLMYFATTGQRPFGRMSDQSLKSYAIGKYGAHPDLEWPCELPKFAAQCKPIIDPCTKECREERPSMDQVHVSLRALEEDGSIGAVEPPSCSPGLMQPDLWKQLSRARRLALSKPKQQKRQPRLAKPKEEDRAASAEQGHLASVPEQDVVQVAKDAAPTNVYRYPPFQPTPRYTMIAGIIDMMLSWNSSIAAESCCEFHASVNLLSSLASMLKEQECTRLTVPGMHVYQCPSCQILIHDDEGSLRALDCNVCGYAGPPGLHGVTS